MLSDLQIAQKASLKSIYEIAELCGIESEYIEPYGRYMAKISPEVTSCLDQQGRGKYIDVTAITPTPLGEGKTVTTIGLSQAIGKLDKKVITCIRQPSLGPVFGIKGGAAGGGYSQVIPMENFNLHLTGDVHAVGLAHNLLAAFIDNSIMHKNLLNIDPLTVGWPRVLDVSDRALRNIVVGLGGKENGVPRETRFDITVASEVMAILALATDLHDLKKRISRIIIGETTQGMPVSAMDLRASGAMTVLLKDAIKPTLMQTLEHTPVFVHAGPFANIAHGNSSIIADDIALKLADYVVTESGFGADCGMEKFMDIKCRYSNLQPDCVVIVATVRALKMHSGKFRVVPGKPLDRGLVEENITALREGCCNLEKHIENARLFGIPVLVALNRFTTDTDNEIDVVREIAMNAGADDFAISDVWSGGGEGGLDMAEKVVKLCDREKDFRLLYPDSYTIKEKIETIATKIYGASGVSYSPLAEKKIKRYTKWRFENLPICMAKTHLSLSHDPSLKGRPEGFTLPIRDIMLSAGAGFFYPLCGEMRTMPGLPSVPAGTSVDIDNEGRIVGLF